MMYRRIAVIFMACVLFFPFSIYAKAADAHELAAAGEEESQPSSEKSGHTYKNEMLIVYPDNMDDNEYESLCRIVETMTFLGHSADYLSQSRAYGRLSKYDAVVCYAVKDSAKMETALAGYSGRVLLLGCMPAALPNNKAYPRRTIFAGGSSGVASYTLNGNNTFKQVISLNSLCLPDNPTYTAGTFSASDGQWPLVCGWGLVRYIPMTDYTTAFSRAVLEQEATLWIWPYNDKPHNYAQFIVIDSVYPFTDPHKLLSKVNKLVDEKINFVISVMPIYKNADFPAMQQFCEVLRFAQANGGAVIMHAPIIQGSIDINTLQQKLTDAADSYFKYQVYPVALEIPRSWMYNENLYATLGRYRTLFVYNDNNTGKLLDLKLAANNFIRLGAQLVSPAVALDAEGTSYLDCCASAVYISSAATLSRTMEMAHAARDSTVPLKSLWNMEQAEYFNGGEMLKWDGSLLKVNGKTAALTYIPKPYEQNHDYKRTVLYRATANLQNQNHTLIIFVIAAMCIFILCMYFARRQMHRRFFYFDDRKKDIQTNKPDRK